MNSNILAEINISRKMTILAKIDFSRQLYFFNIIRLDYCGIWAYYTALRLWRR